MVRRAVAQRPEDGYIVDSLGWAYYRLGRYEDAVEELEKAVLLRPADPTINDHLGDAYWQVGRRLEARFQWSHALDLDPDDELETKVRVKLATGLVEDAVEAAQADDDEAAGRPSVETEGAAKRDTPGGGRWCRRRSSGLRRRWRAPGRAQDVTRR